MNSLGPNKCRRAKRTCFQRKTVSEIIGENFQDDLWIKDSKFDQAISEILNDLQQSSHVNWIPKLDLAVLKSKIKLNQMTYNIDVMYS